MPFTKSRPKIDVDTEKLKDQAADLGATLADMFSVTAPRAGVSFLPELRS